MPTIIAFHTFHDANVCICTEGKLLAVLELERLFSKRYFCSAQKVSVFTDQWTHAINVITKFTGISTFDIGVTSWVVSSQRRVLQSLVHAEKWVTVDHHQCHAALGFYDSPFQHALILSYDGGGNDGTFNIFHGNRDKGIKHVKKVGLNLGTPFKQLASAMPEVTGGKWDPEAMTVAMRFTPLAYAGKLMGYAALGSVREEWLPAFRVYYTQFLTPLISVFNLGESIGLSLEQNALDAEAARDVAATSQYVFTELLLEQVTKFVDLYQSSGDCRLDGIVLTGGCALNVLTNQQVLEQFGYPVHVPPAPSDCGISVGAAWCIQPPTQRLPTLYAGLPLFDVNMLHATAKKRGATQVTAKEVATLLVQGAIIGIVRGRQEFGPRALGHRSLVCYPNRADLKGEINKLKSREWFRPLCPAVTDRSAACMFLGRQASKRWRQSQTKDKFTKCNDPEQACQQQEVLHGNSWKNSSLCIPTQNGDSPDDWIGASPYMSLAPPLTEEAQKLFPAITHFDGTARLQTVSQDSDPWFYSLLEEVGKQADDGGYEILLNTSFNVKGEPILNRLSTALDILDSSPAGTMTHVVVEDWLFTRDQSTFR